MTAVPRRADPDESAAIFAALGDATRLRLVTRLTMGGPQSIARLTDTSSMTRQAITKHLRVLEGAGLVRSVRRGRESRWEIEPDRLELARAFLEKMSSQWDERLEALRRHVEG